MSKMRQGHWKEIEDKISSKKLKMEGFGDRLDMGDK